MSELRPLRLYNFNHAGVPLFVALVVCPGLLALSIWAVAEGRWQNNQGQPQNEFGVAVCAGLAIATLVAAFYVCRVPVLWVEIGSALRYRTLLTVHEYDWADVQRIWFDREDHEGHFAFFFTITWAVHHVLVIMINDYKDLRVLVPQGKLAQLQSLMAIHPRFALQAIDDELESTEEPEEA
jgi:hypothetical protein